jgi:hypothetical protein
MRAANYFPVHSEKTARAPVSQSSTPACGAEASRRLMGKCLDCLEGVRVLVNEG